jgi:geranylgeranyl pyrophosphate synthase
MQSSLQGGGRAGAVLADTPDLVVGTGSAATRPGPGLAEHHAAVGARMSSLLLSGGPFDDAYQHILAAPGKRLRAGMVLACARLVPQRPGLPVPPADILDLACAAEMFHEASLVHDDICDSSPLRRGAPSVAARYGIRHAARVGFHLAGAAVRATAGVFERNPHLVEALDNSDRKRESFRSLGDLSFGQIAERLPPTADTDALRRHYRTVAKAKTGTLFRLACSYGGAAAGCGEDEMDAIADYSYHLSIAFQIMDDIRDFEGTESLGKIKAGTDLDRAIPTWPLIEWLDLRTEAPRIWRAAVERKLCDDQLEQLCADVVDSGATVRAHLVAGEESRAARAALSDFEPSEGLSHLVTLARRVLSR